MGQLFFNIDYSSYLC